jgi:choline dehydrogenase-like flavoprotein
MGTDPVTSPVDPEGRFRGLENLYVADASVFPTSAAVNPSLTIAACALRLGARLAGVTTPRRRFT